MLGDSKRESLRLERQATLWDPLAMALFDRIGLGKGSRVLEVGPGHGSVQAELRRRVQGAVDAVERSAVFADALRGRTRADGFGEGKIFQTDLNAARLDRNAYDVIYARWVLCFLPDPGRHLRQLVRALKPGGLLAIQNYAHRESFALFPRPTTRRERTRQAEPPTKRVRAAVCGAALLGLCLACIAALHGVVRYVRQGSSQALSLAAADINLDGFPDLISGHARPGGGVITLQLGNPEAFAPTMKPHASVMTLE